MIKKILLFLIIFYKNNAFKNNSCTCCNNKKDEKIKNIIDDKIIINEENNNKKINKNKNKNEENNLNELIIKNIINSKIGFTNITNTCYLNSTIQLLIHDNLFLNNFSKLFFSNNNKENILSNNLNKLLLNINKKINKNNNKKNISISISKFKFSVAKKNKKIKNFKIYKQNDAFGFFKLLLNDLEYELINYENKNIIYNEQNNKNKFKINKNFYNIVEISLLNNNNNSIKSFIDENISILKNNINTDKNIIIRLKRGDKDNNNKLTKLFKKIYLDDFIIINSKKYYLKSIVIHIGNKNSCGHYINVTKINNEWYCFSDTECKYCNVRDINDFNFCNNIDNNVKNNAYYMLYSLEP